MGKSISHRGTEYTEKNRTPVGFGLAAFLCVLCASARDAFRFFSRRDAKYAERKHPDCGGKGAKNNITPAFLCVRTEYTKKNRTPVGFGLAAFLCVLCASARDAFRFLSSRDAKNKITPAFLCVLCVSVRNAFWVSPELS